jgi:hypothetical protein
MKVWIMRSKRDAYMFKNHPTQEDMIIPLKELLISDGYMSMDEVENHLDDDATFELIPFDLEPLRPGLRSYSIKKLLRDEKVSGNFVGEIKQE